MKKTFLVLLGAALLVVAGCKKDDNKDNNANGEKMTFTSNFGGGAKTAINEKEMTWTTGDQIIINGETFDSEIFDEGRLAKFTGNVVEPVYQAFYPIGIYKGENSYELPATQTYSGNTLSGVNPMYARSTSTSLDFHNICALVKLDLTGTGIVTRIVAAADQPLSGAFSIAGDETNGYYAQLDSKDAAATVTLDCSNSVVQLNATTPTTFYMALPQGDFTNLTFTVENDKGMTAIAKQLALCPLQAGHLSNEVAQVAFVPAGALTGVFSVSTTKKVHFSKGNLQATYNGSAYTFGFASNQYSYVGNAAGNTTIDSQTSGAVVDLFGWSTATTNYGISTSTDDVYSGNFADWGKAVGDGITWRTLTTAEWQYLFSYGDYANSIRVDKYNYGVTVCGKANCVVLLPDDWKWEGTVGAGWQAGGYSEETQVKWSAMVAAGAVCLPAAGYRKGSSVRYGGSFGQYWSSSASDRWAAYYLDFYNEVTPNSNQYRTSGCSVRLVAED